ncbi:MAG: glucose 1-dehydrogenase [Verrucomicrobiota bacterium]
MNYKNKTVVITGATSGIGKAAALAFADAGANVVVAGRRHQEGQAVAEEIRAKGAGALFVATDVTDEGSVQNLVEQAVSEFGSIDVAFNNAGVEGTTVPIADENTENFERTFGPNVLGVLLSMKHEIAQFRKQGRGGVIINTASVVGHRGMAGAGVYVASKHAVVGLTKTAALEVSAEGIRVLSISPAVIQTDMYERFTGGDQGAQDYMTTLHPIGRVGTVGEVAQALLYLAGDGASFVTGTDLAIDGGFLA